MTRETLARLARTEPQVPLGLQAQLDRQDQPVPLAQRVIREPLVPIQPLPDQQDQRDRLDLLVQLVPQEVMAQPGQRERRASRVIPVLLVRRALPDPRVLPEQILRSRDLLGQLGLPGRQALRGALEQPGPRGPTQRSPGQLGQQARQALLGLPDQLAPLVRTVPPVLRVQPVLTPRLPVRPAQREPPEPLDRLGRQGSRVLLALTARTVPLALQEPRVPQVQLG